MPRTRFSPLLQHSRRGNRMRAFARSAVCLHATAGTHAAPQAHIMANALRRVAAALWQRAPTPPAGSSWHQGTRPTRSDILVPAPPTLCLARHLFHSCLILRYAVRPDLLLRRTTLGRAPTWRQRHLFAADISVPILWRWRLTTTSRYSAIGLALRLGNRDVSGRVEQLHSNARTTAGQCC